MRHLKIDYTDFYRSKLRGIKPCRFRIALKVIRVICEICGLIGKRLNSAIIRHTQGGLGFNDPVEQ